MCYKTWLYICFKTYSNFIYRDNQITVFILVLPEKQDEWMYHVCHIHVVTDGAWLCHIVPPPYSELHPFIHYSWWVILIYKTICVIYNKEDGDGMYDRWILISSWHYSTHSYLALNLSNCPFISQFYPRDKYSTTFFNTVILMFVWTVLCWHYWGNFSTMFLNTIVLMFQRELIIHPDSSHSGEDVSCGLLGCDAVL
jgi:hypothetical protein